MEFQYLKIEIVLIFLRFWCDKFLFLMW